MALNFGVVLALVAVTIRFASGISNVLNFNAGAATQDLSVTNTSKGTRKRRRGHSLRNRSDHPQDQPSTQVPNEHGEQPLQSFLSSQFGLLLDAKQGLGSRVALTHHGYKSIFRAHDEKQTFAFVDRFIKKYNATVTNYTGLVGIIAHHAGRFRPTPTYAELMRELATADWLYGFLDASKVTLDEDGYQLIADLENDGQMRAFIRRVIVAHGGREAAGHLSIPGRLVFPDGAHLFGMAPLHSGTISRKSYSALVSELREAKWIDGFQAAPVTRMEDDHVRLDRASTQCAECTEKAMLFIGVFSAPDNFQRREDVRKSWMQDRILQWRRPYVRAKFIIGQTSNASLNFAIEEENRVYGDIQRLSVSDTYENSPSKSIAFFRWFASRFCCNPALPKFWYAMKLDDDSWPNLQILLPYLRQRKMFPSTMNYVGGFVWHRPVQRRGQRAETADKSDFALNSYPAHAAGSGYILSLDLARKLNQDFEDRLPMVMLSGEDTTIGNWVKQENHVTMSVHYYDVNVTRYGCEDETMIAMSLCTGALRCMWEKRLLGMVKGTHKSVNMCCKSPELSGTPGLDC